MITYVWAAGYFSEGEHKTLWVSKEAAGLYNYSVSDPTVAQL